MKSIDAFLQKSYFETVNGGYHEPVENDTFFETLLQGTGMIVVLTIGIIALGFYLFRRKR